MHNSKERSILIDPSEDTIDFEGRHRYATRSIIRFGSSSRVSESATARTAESQQVTVCGESNDESLRADVVSSGTGARRFHLEHTFVQGSENELTRLLSLLRLAREASHNSENRNNSTISTATAINLLLNGFQSEDSRLGAALLQACAETKESPLWERRFPDSLTPLRVAKSLHEAGRQAISRDALPSHLHFSAGPLAGKVYSIWEVGAIPKRAFNCLGPHLSYSMLTRASLFKQVRSAANEVDRSESLEKLLNFTIETSSLVFTMIFSDYQDKFPDAMIPRGPDVFRLSASDWGKLMARVKLSRDQLKLCLQARESIYEDELAEQIGNSCMEDVLHALLDASDTTDQAILDTVDIIQKTKIQHRVREMKVVMHLWFAIFTPQQFGLLGNALQFEYTQLYSGRLQDWITIYYECFTTESWWMDCYDPDNHLYLEPQG